MLVKVCCISLLTKSSNKLQIICLTFELKNIMKKLSKQWAYLFFSSAMHALQADTFRSQKDKLEQENRQLQAPGMRRTARRAHFTRSAADPGESGRERLGAAAS